MRTDGVVVFQPTLCDQTDLPEIIKQTSIQNFFTVGAVEALNVGILCRLAGLDMEQLDMVVFGPTLQPLRDQLRTVIHTNASWLFSLKEQLLQDSHNPFCRKRSIYFDPECFPVEI